MKPAFLALLYKICALKFAWENLPESLPESLPRSSTLSEKSNLSAMAYVDLNPIRAKISDSVTSSEYASIRIRGNAVRAI